MGSRSGAEIKQNHFLFHEYFGAQRQLIRKKNNTFYALFCVSCAIQSGLVPACAGPEAEESLVQSTFCAGSQGQGRDPPQPLLD